MTLVSEIISDAYRVGNLIGIGESPTPDEETEALRYLNRIVSSVFGAEIGDPLTAIPLGNSGIVRPTDYPIWGNEPDGEWFVPKNSRLILNLDESKDYYLHPNPDNGTRVAVQDIAGSLSGGPVTLYGNGRLIEGQPFVVLSVDHYDAQWFYRDDIGSWTKVSPLLGTDGFPFPEEFEDFFVAMLAGRLNPSYGTAMDVQTQEMLRRARNLIRARYRQSIPTCTDPAIFLAPRSSRERNWWNRPYGFGPAFGDAPWRRWPW